MEDRSSRTSIIVALIAIVLIVGGIFLLNQSISSQRSTTKEKGDTKTVVVVPEEEAAPTNFEECRAKGGFIIQGPPQECTYAGKRFVEQTNKTDESKDTTTDTDKQNDTSSTSSGSTSNQPKQPNEPSEPTTPTSPTTPTKLGPNEFTAKLTAINGNESKYVIVDSGFVNSKWVKAGSNLKLVGINKSSYGVTLTIGKTYRFKANITELPNGFQVNSVDSVVQID